MDRAVKSEVNAILRLRNLHSHNSKAIAHHIIGWLAG
jgi:hypothetical protein